jgi:hypothetical protein
LRFPKQETEWWISTSFEWRLSLFVRPKPVSWSMLLSATRRLLHGHSKRNHC